SLPHSEAAVDPQPQPAHEAARYSQQPRLKPGHQGAPTGTMPERREFSGSPRERVESREGRQPDGVTGAPDAGGCNHEVTKPLPARAGKVSPDREDDVFRYLQRQNGKHQRDRDAPQGQREVVADTG